ncbi:peptidase S11 D-alanyl-D-alanine carboxypeptidase 1 [Paenibacillus sp. 32O-W]|uniref:D-alanyl-D-alanine carboxypeptidase family protein n=1 Tax=Paenibacillus sp. 32O-W TaxID=1695218 RepID=UPI00071F8FF7|nr:D-alanyl-D-alanine carboxypeptidase family protein [Paenibacillus sp. 32O-W]ALS26492.1 peptidase S11 D-alanyl-D-alanine carboxypeptidase 1 [Paenibacillus sp. 32O-W]
MKEKWSGMLKSAILLTVLVLLINPIYPAASAGAEEAEETGTEERADEASPPELEAESGILIDARSGAVLYAKNPDEPLYPASITKIVTGIIALEVADPQDIVTVSKEARHEDGTRVYLAEGEQLTMERLVYALMLNSGNDAATAIAEHIDGSKEAFAERMNRFVKETVGTKNTVFKNPHGLPDPEQHTTAADMALIARYAMQNESFRRIVGTPSMPWSGEEWESRLVNHNKLLGTYEGATGVKNGYTNDAGFTLVGSAARGDMELIGVIMKAPNDEALYDDMTAMLDYGFASFEPMRLFSEGEQYPYLATGEDPRFQADEDIWAVVPKGETPELSVGEDGSITVKTSGGEAVAGKLRPLETAAAASAAPEAGAAAGGAADGPARSVWKNGFMVLWLLLNVFIAWIARRLYVRARTRKMEYAQKYWRK